MGDVRSTLGGKDPWLRYVGGTADDYRRFLEYLQLGRARSLTALCRARGYSRKKLATLSSDWAWSARARAWDQHVAERRLRRIEESEERQAELEARNVEKALRLTGRMLDKYNRMSDEDPGFVIKPSEMVDLLDRAVQLSRLGRGQPNESVRVEQNIRDAGEKVRAAIEAISSRVRDGESTLEGVCAVEPEERDKPEPEDPSGVVSDLRRLPLPQARPEPRPRPVEVVDALPYPDPTAPDARWPV